jgi:hypothetical protein
MEHGTEIRGKSVTPFRNNRRIETNEIWGYNDRYLFDRCTFLNFRDHVLIHLIRYGWDSRHIDFYKVNSDGSIERVGGVSHQGFFE